MTAFGLRAGVALLTVLVAGCGDGGAQGRNPPTGAAPLAIPDDPRLPPAPSDGGTLRLTPLGQYIHGGRSTSAAEIAAYHAPSHHLFVVNVEKGALDVLDLTDPSNLTLVGSADVNALGTPTSAAVSKAGPSAGMIAASVAPKSKRDRGTVVFLSPDGSVLKTLLVGHHPDMLTFSPDGRWLLVACEGEPEPDYSFDPEGSISLIDVTGGLDSLTTEQVTDLDFRQFNDQRDTLEPGVRIYPQAASVAQDLEPEYIAVSPDSRIAWASCQENNAIAVIDLEARRVTRLAGLGFKDHNLEGNGFDASDKDGRIRIRPWPVKGMYQPDGMASFTVDGKTYLVTANDGKGREYEALNEECRVSDLKLDPAAFPNAAELQAETELGRLMTTRFSGDANGDGLHEAIYSYGGRSFAIWDASVAMLFDSGDQFERILADRVPQAFNSDHKSLKRDDRSDNKGPEPEGVALGEIGGRTYAFIGLERAGGVMVYDITSPAAPIFETYSATRSLAPVPATADSPEKRDDLGPEGIVFISAVDSPIGSPLLVLANEVSGTTRVLRIDATAAAGSTNP